MEKKDWHQSLTIWFNIIVLVLGATAEVLKLFPNAAQISVVVVAVLNIALRFKTEQGIK